MGRRRKAKPNFHHYQAQTGTMAQRYIPNQYQAQTGAMPAQRYIPKQQFRLGEKLDLTESRSIEFKAGPGFIKHDFQENVGKYVCGFVNSYEDGTLMLGVEDSGIVRGYSLNRGEEDRMRRQVDEAIKDITPDVFPKNYSLRFVPVIDHHGDHSGDVIVISVTGSHFEGEDRLYESKHGVFLRRDGGIEGPLKAKKIQEWIKRNYESKMEEMRRNERNIQKELENVKSQSDRKGRELELKEKDLAKKDEQYKLRKKYLAKKDEQYKFMKEDLAKKDEQYRLMEKDLQKKNLENEQQKSVIRRFENWNQEQNLEHNSEETLKKLVVIEQLLTKKNKSTVCAIL